MKYVPITSLKPLIIYIGLKCSNDKKKKKYGLMIFKAYTLLTNTLKKKKVNTLITTKMV